MGNGIAGQAKNLDIAGKLRIRIDGFQDSDFSECSELKTVLEVAEYWSGGEATAHKQYTGKVSFPDLTPPAADVPSVAGRDPSWRGRS